jgi:release factor glutamine methyltransferase
VAVRPAEIVRRSAEYLARHGVDSPTSTAEALLMSLLRTDRAGLYQRDEAMDDATARLFARALCQRCHGAPLQYLTGEQQFMDIRLQVAPGVFIPRPETEGLVEAALEVLPMRPSAVVDVGTGTGAVALAVKHHRPESRVVATDVSEAAVTLAKSNADRLGLDVEVLLGNLLDPVPGDLRGAVDLVVSNPPYVTREEYESLPAEVKSEPYEALVGGTQVHGKLAHSAGSWLRRDGWLVMEIGSAQAVEVRALLDGRFDHVQVLPDLAGRDRVVRGQLIDARPRRPDASVASTGGAKPGWGRVRR